MRIYIRHAEKAYRNGHPFNCRSNDTSTYYHAHDPPLTEKGRNDAAELAVRLLELYPTPTKIICSPYLRTRETAAIMAGVVIKNKGPREITVCCDSDLSEYLGHHGKRHLDVSLTTWRHHPPHPERWKDFENRIERHCCGVTTSPDEVVWLITHGIVIHGINRYYNDDCELVDYLDYIIRYDIS